MAAESFDFEAWFAEYVMSVVASRRIRACGQRYGARPHDVDDVRLTWYERVIRTVRRSGLPGTVFDADQATPYVLVAARRAAHDLACQGPGSKEDPSDDRFEIHPPPYGTDTGTTDPDLPQQRTSFVSPSTQSVRWSRDGASGREAPQAEKVP